MMSFKDHYNFFQGSIPCAFSYAINSTFYLACAILNTSNAVCSSQAQVIMAMHRNNSLVDIFNIFFQKADLFTVLFGQAISVGVRDIDNCSTCCDHSFHHFCQKFIVGSTCIFGIELNIFNKTLCIFYRINRTF